MCLVDAGSEKYLTGTSGSFGMSGWGDTFTPISHFCIVRVLSLLKKKKIEWEICLKLSQAVADPVLCGCDPVSLLAAN